MTRWPPHLPRHRHTPVPELVVQMDPGQRLRLLVSRLPVDPDLVPEAAPALAPVVVAACVAIGGAAGALGRAGLAWLWPYDVGGWAWATLVTNLVGCAALAGLLVTLLEIRPRSRYLRPLLGTGLLGGFTTFSTFVVDAAQLVRVDRSAAAAGYVALTVLGSLLACLTGLLLARWLLRSRSPDRWHRQLDRARAQYWDGMA